MPEVVGAAIFAAIGATAVGETAIVGTLTVAGLVGSIVTTGALVGAELLLAPKPDIPKAQDGKILLKQAVPPAIWGIGEGRIAGAYASYDMGGSTSYDPIAVCQDGPIDSYQRFYLNEDVVSFDVGQVDGPVSCAILGRYQGDGADEKDVSIYWRLGLDTETAYSQFVTARPDLWTDACRGDNIASILLVTNTPKDKNFSKRLPFGLPKPSVVGRWVKCWDFRDETQHPADRTTWKWTQNPMVVLLWYYCHARPGYGRPVDVVYTPRAGFWVAAADRCDEVMERHDGTTEPRYAVSGHFDGETPRKSVVEALLRCCDGWLSEMGDGSIVVYAGAYYEPTLTLTNDHVLNSEIQRGYLEDERVNQLVTKVTSREHDYNEVDANPRVIQSEIDAGAKLVSAEATSEWSPSWTQSERLAAIELDKKRAKLRGTLITNLFGENIKGRRYFMLDLDDQNATRMVPCEVVDVTDDSVNTGTWQIEFRSVGATRYDWNKDTDEGPPPPVPDNSEDDDLPVPTIPTLAVVRQQIAGGGVIAVISATDPPVTGWTDLRLDGHFRRVGDSVWQSMTAPDDDLQVFSGAVTDGSFEVQTRFIGGGGGSSDYSPTATITVVSDATAPGSPTAFTLSGATTKSLSARAANSPNVKSMEFRRGGPTDAFSAATSLGFANCGPNQVISGTDTPGTGAWRYWATDLNGSGVTAVTPAGPAVTGVGTEAEAFLTRATAVTDETRKGLYRYLIARLVAAGVLAKLDGLAILAAPDATTAGLNLKGTSYALVPHGGLTFTADRGYVGDGTSGYLDTGFNPATAGGLFSQNSAHMGVFVLAAPNYTSGSTTYDFGATNADISARQVSSADGATHGNAAGGKTITGSGSAAPAHICWSRTASTGYAHYVNGVATSAATVASSALQSLNLFACAHNVAGSPANFSTRPLAALHWGSGITAADDIAINAILHDFLLAIGAVSV